MEKGIKFPYADELFSTKEREAMSPEGVEERIVSECAVQVRLTGGGKFRVYGYDGEGGFRAIGVHDSKDEALRCVIAILSAIIMTAKSPENMLRILIGGKDDTKQ